MLATLDRSPNRSQSAVLNASSLASPSSPLSPSSSFSASSSSSSLKTYVVAEILESKADRLLTQLQSRVVHTNVDSLLEYDELRELASNETSLNLVLRYLEAQRKILVDENSIPGKRLIKFTLNSTRQVCGNISELELAFMKVRLPEKNLKFIHSLTTVWILIHIFESTNF